MHVVGCLVMKKTGVDSKGKPVGSQCIGWQNECLVGKSRLLKR